MPFCNFVSCFFRISLSGHSYEAPDAWNKLDVRTYVLKVTVYTKRTKNLLHNNYKLKKLYRINTTTIIVVVDSSSKCPEVSFHNTTEFRLHNPIFEKSLQSGGSFYGTVSEDGCHCLVEWFRVQTFIYLSETLLSGH